jgi:hypothetical protein
MRVAAPARDGDDGVNRDGKTSETEKPEYSGGPARLQQGFEDIGDRVGVRAADLLALDQ